LIDDFIQTSPVVKEIMKDHGWIFEYISNHSGQFINDFRQLSAFHNVLYIQVIMIIPIFGEIHDKIDIYYRI
jgi:hypothetical protein